MKNEANGHAAATWEVTIAPQEPSDAAFRMRLLDQYRPALERHLREHPEATEVMIPAGPLVVRARRRDGSWKPGGDLRLVCAADMPSLAPVSRKEADPDITQVLLPHPDLLALRNRLVGLEEISTRVLLYMQCAWDGRAKQWGAQPGRTLPADFHTQLNERACAFVFAGAPGVGKTATALTACDQYCRVVGIGGAILRLSATVRGEGLVGQVSQRIHAAFERLRSFPAEEFKCLLVDEADSIAVRRTGAHIHHEDHAGVNALLQALDMLGGLPRTAVFFTTNLANTYLDKAVLRRVTVIAFPEPSFAARKALIARWLPDLNPKEVECAARVAHGMSPADLEQALTQILLEAIGADRSITATAVIEGLKHGPRTGRVEHETAKQSVFLALGRRAHYTAGAL
jgi:hypothetical protein